jgi:hypothetical protein
MGPERIVNHWREVEAEIVSLGTQMTLSPCPGVVFPGTRAVSFSFLGVGIVAQKVSATARMTSTNKSDLNSASGRPGLTN